MTVTGFDVSHHQGDVVWSRVARSDLRFTYIKASEGTTFVDPLFEANWSGARDEGVLHGAYHFARPGTDPEVQAAHFASVVGQPAWGELPPALDLETMDNQSRDAVVQWTLAFVRKAESLFGRKLAIYTGAMWRNQLGNPMVSELSSRVLWTARYSRQEPQVPKTWTRWDFWQFTDGTHGEVIDVPGVRGRCDCNRFRGDMAELTQLTAASPTDHSPAPAPALDDSAWLGEYFVWPHRPVIRGEHVLRWQTRLHELGFVVEPDGAYGPESKQACIAFQRELGLTPHGIVDRPTWQATFDPSTKL